MDSRLTRSHQINYPASFKNTLVWNDSFQAMAEQLLKLQGLLSLVG